MDVKYLNSNRVILSNGKNNLLFTECTEFFKSQMHNPVLVRKGEPETKNNLLFLCTI